MARHDVVVVGAGHNGLVAAVLLARAGLDVLAVEANSDPGGCIWTEQLESGHRLERGAVDHTDVFDVVDELDLTGFGLEYHRRAVNVGAAFGDGRVLLFPVDDTALDGALEDTGDIAGYRRLATIGSSLFTLVDGFATPPTLTDLATALRGLPVGDDLLRLVLSSSDSVLTEHLTDDHLMSAIAMYGAHSQVPSFMPGTGMFALLLPASHGEAPGRPRGGSIALIDALVAALEAAGGTLALDARVVGIDDESGVRRVRLADGRTVDTDRVVSSIDVRRTSRLLAPAVPELEAAASRTHDGSLNVGEIKIDVALTDRPSFGPLDSAPQAIWMVQQETDSLRRAYGDIIAGRIPTSPAFMWASPSETDASAAPPGAGVVWISAFMPFTPAAGPWTRELEQHASDLILDGLATITGTDLRDHSVAVAVTGPTGWAHRLGSDTGNPNHLDLTIDQLLGWRPPGMAANRTPASWLYLSGAGTHPGGGLSGKPGRNAARAVIADMTGTRRPTSRGARIASVKAAIDVYRAMRK